MEGAADRKHVSDTHTSVNPSLVGLPFCVRTNKFWSCDLAPGKVSPLWIISGLGATHHLHTIRASFAYINISCVFQEFASSSKVFGISTKKSMDFCEGSFSFSLLYSMSKEKVLIGARAAHSSFLWTPSDLASMHFIPSSLYMDTWAARLLFIYLGASSWVTFTWQHNLKQSWGYLCALDQTFPASCTKQHLLWSGKNSTFLTASISTNRTTDKR